MPKPTSGRRADSGDGRGTRADAANAPEDGGWGADDEVDGRPADALLGGALPAGESLVDACREAEFREVEYRVGEFRVGEYRVDHREVEPPDGLRAG